MQLPRLAGWLRCPVCTKDLLPFAPLSLGCDAGHSFDVNKRGYVNLTPSGTRMIADGAAMLEDRAAFLADAHYLRLARAVSVAAGTATRVLDAGCGTGYYLASLLETHPDAVALAMDLSPEAVRRATRATGADGLVADTWRPLPLRSGICDVILDVFAPRNLAEFHRVLADDGRLIVVVPTAGHLWELRTAGRVIGIAERKTDSIRAEAAGLFRTAAVERVEFEMLLEQASVDRLVGMGPSAHHRREWMAPTDQTAPIAVTVSVDVITLAKRGP